MNEYDIREQIIPAIQSAIEHNTRGLAETIAKAVQKFNESSTPNEAD